MNSPILRQWQRALAHYPRLMHLDASFQTHIAASKPHGQFARWLALIADLPAGDRKNSDLSNSVITATNAPVQTLAGNLRELMPWRKGPFSLNGVYIDSEWRSDHKFSRLLAAGVDFRDKNILDVGCGNGYFLYRMLGMGARFALGIDPSWHYFAQYLALDKILAVPHCAFLPLTLDGFSPGGFDITLSMGVLYHRRDPLQHLTQLRDTLRPGGLLVVETLTVAGDAQSVLMPAERYAGMRNVWFLPSAAALSRWLQRLGFAIESCGTPVSTTRAEQRSTAWSTGPSLADFMQPDFTATIENLPPPQRLIITARRKN